MAFKAVAHAKGHSDGSRMGSVQAGCGIAAALCQYSVMSAASNGDLHDFGCVREGKSAGRGALSIGSGCFLSGAAHVCSGDVIESECVVASILAPAAMAALGAWVAVSVSVGSDSLASSGMLSAAGLPSLGGSERSVACQLGAGLCLMYGWGLPQPGAPQT